MADYELVRVIPVRLGDEYPVLPRPLTIVDVTAAESKPFPPKNLLFSRRSAFVQQGLVDTDNSAYPRYKASVLALLKKHVAVDRMLVFPEFAFCADLEGATHDLLQKYSKQNHGGRSPVVVGGSYYMQTAAGLAIVSPVFAGGKVYHQEKYLPAKGEKGFGGFAKHPFRKIVVFTDTGYGDFAVQVCSDVLHERFDEDVVRCLRGRIDFLVVVSRNKSSALTERLHDLARRERWTIVYVNGDAAYQDQASAIFTPTSQKSTIRLTSTRPMFQLDVATLERLIADDTSLRGLSDTERFPPTPRHWPYKGRRALTFGRFLKVLAIGSHFDDVWHGCLGTLMMLQENYSAEIVCTSLCEIYPHPYFGVYQLQDRAAAIEQTCASTAEGLGFRWHSAKNTRLTDRAFDKAALVRAFDELRDLYSDADLVFVPRSDDLNPEHNETARHAVVKFQTCDVFEYEVKDFRRVPFRPNVFVDLGGTSSNGWGTRQPTTFAEKKADVLDHLARAIFGELPRPFRRDRTLGRMSFRAAENAKACDYAEAFVSEFIV